MGTHTAHIQAHSTYQKGCSMLNVQLNLQRKHFLIIKLHKKRENKIITTTPT